MPIQCVLGAGTFHLWRVFGQQASAMMLVHRSEPCFTNHISAWEPIRFKEDFCGIIRRFAFFVPLGARGRTLCQCLQLESKWSHSGDGGLDLPFATLSCFP
jgi:hypothetical protein